MRLGISFWVDASVTDSGGVGTRTKVRICAQLRKHRVGVLCVTMRWRRVKNLLIRCATVHRLASMTSAYETGHAPEIEVRHRLRIAREYAGLEQEDLAERSGISRSTISSAELGKKQPHRMTVNAWALACGVPASWIWTGKNPPADPNDGVANPTGPQPNGCRATPTLQVVNPRKRSRFPVNASAISPVTTQRVVSCRRDNLRATG